MHYNKYIINQFTLSFYLMNNYTFNSNVYSFITIKKVTTIDLYFHKVLSITNE